MIFIKQNDEGRLMYRPSRNNALNTCIVFCKFSYPRRIVSVESFKNKSLSYATLYFDSANDYLCALAINVCPHIFKLFFLINIRAQLLLPTT